MTEVMSDRTGEWVEEVIQHPGTSYQVGWVIYDSGAHGKEFERLVRMVDQGHDYTAELVKLGMPLPSRRVFRRPPRDRVSPALRRQVYERDGYQCQHCGCGENLQIDHVHPVSRGGATSVDNLQTLCGTCNQRKRDRI